MSITTDHVLTITQDLFSAMVDGEPGLVTEWLGDLPDAADPVHAWVDVRSARPVRAMVTTERTTAEQIARALLVMAPDEVVPREDMRDALGEIANVVGGNLKGMMPDSGALTVPTVVRGPSGMSGAPQWQRPMAWRGDPVVISLWNLEQPDGKESQ